MVLVVFERHALVGYFGDVMFGCFSGVMFGYTLIGGYGRMRWNHMPHQGYSKMWRRHMVVGGMSHTLSFLLGMWHELVAGLGVCGFVIKSGWLLVYLIW